MAQHPPAPPAAGPSPTAAGPSPTAVTWRYVIFWVLFLGLILFISLYGVVAEA